MSPLTLGSFKLPVTLQPGPKCSECSKSIKREQPGSTQDTPGGYSRIQHPPAAGGQACTAKSELCCVHSCQCPSASSSACKLMAANSGGVTCGGASLKGSGCGSAAVPPAKAAVLEPCVGLVWLAAAQITMYLWADKEAELIHCLARGLPVDSLCYLCHRPSFKDWTLQENIGVGATEPREHYTVLSAVPLGMRRESMLRVRTVPWTLNTILRGVKRWSKAKVELMSQI